ncbi:SIMPL domain-containing protein [Parvularcula sp. ZS-1/3]|uniref:SIMPL domain-containing protein n=1 Tax=Parvularcula mediterranea TaxID=2732508 RepID=A0A7Y3W6E5_9PROT|nr:SIMPL domain-containing protein [Parvularcula mediterranea]NNU17453.1 SIMPL domain-containing protein [Parvularcula mediterranea]
MRGILLSAAVLTLITACTDDTIIQAAPPNRQINVTGEATVSAVPDIAMLSFTVRAQGASAAEAFAQSAEGMESVLGAVGQAGVAERDRQTGEIRLNPVFDYDERGRQNRNKIVGYEAFNTLTVRLRDIGKAGGVIDAAVRAGANGLDSFRLGIDDTTGLRDEARIAAVRDARRKAEAMAEAAGARLGDVITLSVSGGSRSPQPMMMRSMAMEADMPGPPIEAGEQDLRVTVNATFALK